MKFNKSLVLIFLSFLSIEPLKGTNLKIADSSVRASESLGKVKLTHNDRKGFSLYENGKKHEIGRHSLSPELRSITSKDLKAFQKAGYLSVNKQSDGEFSIKSHVRGEGGGIIGCAIGAFIGKAITIAVFQTPIAIITAATFAVCPPMAPVVFASLEGAALPFQEAVSIPVVLATASAGAVLTGPV